MTNKKWLALYISTILLIAIAVTAGVIWIKPDNSELLEKVNNAEEVVVIKPIEVEPSDPQDKSNILSFYNKIKNIMSSNDTAAFNNLLLDQKHRYVLFDQASGMCAGYAETPNDATPMPYLENGSLMAKSEVVDPPEYELGISIDDFGNSEPVYREVLTKEGLISNIDWSKIEIEYLEYHSADIFYELLWTIDIAGDNAPHDWCIYKLFNNTYIISNVVGWYDPIEECRTMSGKVIVVNKVSNDFKIATFIEIV